MKRYTILIFLVLLLIMCICSCKSYNYKEGFSSSVEQISELGTQAAIIEQISELGTQAAIIEQISELGTQAAIIEQISELGTQAAIIEQISELGTLENQNTIKDKLTSIQKQLDDGINYKDTSRIQENNSLNNRINEITTYQEIINELNNLKLDILYKTEITELPTLEINETVLSKYKNIIKTKYLIDNGTITSYVNNKVYKEIDVIFKPPEASFPENTNDTYFNDNFENDLHIKYGSNPSNTQKLMFISNIAYDIDYDIPEIFTRGSNGIDIYTDFNKHTNLKEYGSNTKFRKDFNKQVDKYKTDLEYIINQKNETKTKFENGEYLSSGSGDII